MGTRYTIDDMMKGLVRAAEAAERNGGGSVWDDQVREALQVARELGWGKDQIGSMSMIRSATDVWLCSECFEVDATDPHASASSCITCGAYLCAVRIESKLAERIQKNASHIGRVRWPNDEDKLIASELDAHRRANPAPRGRSTARELNAEGSPIPNRWRVMQRMPNGTSRTVVVDAEDETRAYLAAAPHLPVPVPSPSERDS